MLTPSLTVCYNQKDFCHCGPRCPMALLPFENLKGTRWDKVGAIREWWPPGGGHLLNTFKGLGVSPNYSLVDLKIFLCYNSIRSEDQSLYVMIRSWHNRNPLSYFDQSSLSRWGVVSWRSLRNDLVNCKRTLGKVNLIKDLYYWLIVLKRLTQRGQVW